MSKITCYIRRNRKNPSSICPYESKRLRIFPWVMETYPDIRNRNKILQRRDFECRSVDEAEKIAVAVYGERAEILKDSPLLQYED